VVLVGGQSLPHSLRTRAEGHPDPYTVHIGNPHGLPVQWEDLCAVTRTGSAPCQGRTATRNSCAGTPPPVVAWGSTSVVSRSTSLACLLQLSGCCAPKLVFSLRAVESVSYNH
jgi:hypothetical protein